MNNQEPITGPGIEWAWKQINKRFENAAKQVVERGGNSICPETVEEQPTPLIPENNP